MNCKDVERVLTPYVDGEGVGDRESVAVHLDRCPPCAAHAATEATARRLVRQRGQALSRPAPAALRCRCQALASYGRAASPWWSWRGLRLAGAMAAVLLTTALAYAIVTGSSTLFAAGLTVDHLKCFALPGSGSSRTTASAVASKLQRSYGWHVGVPPGAREMELELVGARRCLSTDGTVAHVLYRHAGKPLSLFVLPDHPREPEALSVLGHRSRIWSRGGTTFVLVAGEGNPRVEQVERYFLARAY